MPDTTRKSLTNHLIFWSTLILGLFAAWWVSRHYNYVELWLKQAGWLGPMVSIGLYSLLSLTPIPSDPLTILNGVIFGPVKGLLVSWMGNNAAAMTEYVVFRQLGNISSFETKKDQLPQWVKKWPVNSIYFLILVRVVPGWGGKVVAVMAGIYHVSWWRFLWTSAVANFAGSFLYTLSSWGFFKFL